MALFVIDSPQLFSGPDGLELDIPVPRIREGQVGHDDFHS